MNYHPQRVYAFWPCVMQIGALIMVFALTVVFVGSLRAEEVKLPFPVPRNISELPDSALIETTKGPFEIRFYRKEAPISVANFVYLVQQGTYNGVAFHRYEPGFIIQGGDPTGTRKGGPGWTLPPEINDRLRHTRGAVGWARLADQVNPERRSSGSQFYITLAPTSGVDGFYTIFAQVVAGMDNVDQLRLGDKILSVRLPKKKQGLVESESWSSER